MNRCRKCPAPAEMTCHAIRTGHARFCKLIAMGRPGYREYVLSETLDPTPPEGGGEGEGDPGPMAAPAPDPVPMEVHRAILRCEFRTRAPHCGCAGKWRCGRDEADVSYQECVSCKSAGGASGQPNIGDLQ